MKLVTTADKKEEKRQVTLQQGEKAVAILVDGYCILKLLNIGEIERTGSVPSFLGFEIDSFGRVIIK
jgi:hypothetical protein